MSEETVLSKPSLEDRALLAIEVYDLIENHTECFSSTCVAESSDRKEFRGDSSVGVDLSYLLGAILKGETVMSFPDYPSALFSWLKSECPQHPVHAYIEWVEEE